MGGYPPEFELHQIEKPEETRWRARGLRVEDINLDGKLDILGMLIHWNGYLPTDKGAVFYMTYGGGSTAKDNWTTYVIKWGGGYRGFGEYIGKKWDQALIEDVNLNGWPDIVANVEEYQYWIDYVFRSIGISQTITVYLAMV